MPTKKVLKNRHPVDRLFDLREQIKALESEEKALKSDIMRTGDYEGADYVAMPKTSNQRRLDRAALTEAFGAEAVEACCKDVAVTTLNLFKKADIKTSIFD